MRQAGFCLHPEPWVGVGGGPRPAAVYPKAGGLEVTQRRRAVRGALGGAQSQVAPTSFLFLEGIVASSCPLGEYWHHLRARVPLHLWVPCHRAPPPWFAWQWALLCSCPGRNRVPWHLLSEPLSRLTSRNPDQTRGLVQKPQGPVDRKALCGNFQGLGAPSWEGQASGPSFVG